MAKIPRRDPRAAHMSSDTRVDRAAMLDFVRTRHRWVLSTTRSDGRPQMSLVTGGVTSHDRLVVATYPERAKAANATRQKAASVLVLGESFHDPWIQVDGDAEVLTLPEAMEGLVDYYRSISGEHPDWEEYRQAMAEQGKCVIVVEPARWGPVSTGGFPPSLFEAD